MDLKADDCADEESEQTRTSRAIKNVIFMAMGKLKRALQGATL
jgi:hypothetical protein